MIQGGDITKADGTGGASIYGGEFEDENIGWREIDREGLVCMANRGKGTNSSQYVVTSHAPVHTSYKQQGQAAANESPRADSSSP